MRRIAITFTGAAVMLLPGAAWCAEGGTAVVHGSWLTLGFYVINFALFIWLIRWLDRRYGRITHNHFTARARTIKETFSRAETTLKQAEELANQARELAARLEADKAQLRAEIEAETSYMVEGLRQKAREAAGRIVRDSRLTGDAMIEGARRRLRELLAEATGRLALSLVSRNFTADDQIRLLQSFQSRLSQEARQ
jgi:F0F1-type ATP synthase membrane subunit b/b'